MRYLLIALATITLLPTNAEARRDEVFFGKNKGKQVQHDTQQQQLNALKEQNKLLQRLVNEQQKTQQSLDKIVKSNETLAKEQSKLLNQLISLERIQSRDAVQNVIKR